MNKIKLSALLLFSVFTCCAAQFPFGFWKTSGGGGSWPTGSDGALSITTGNTVRVAPGTNKDYSSITIDAGGTLELSSNCGGVYDNQWAIIGVSGNLVNNGLIKYVCYDQNGSNGTSSTTAPDGASLSFSYTQSAGGNSTAASLYGNGGGGQGGGSGAGMSSPIRTSGGDGNAGSGDSGGAPGVGGSVYGSNGGNGSSGGCDPDGGDGGSGGGARGYSGGPIYVKVAGNYSGSGEWRVSGSNGGSGGSSDSGGCLGAGVGGGGGAGGSGGIVKLRYHGTNTFSGTYTTTAGTGGAAGSGGGPSPGSNGSVGSTDVAAY